MRTNASRLRRQNLLCEAIAKRYALHGVNTGDRGLDP